MCQKRAEAVELTGALFPYGSVIRPLEYHIRRPLFRMAQQVIYDSKPIYDDIL
jgi:hypothetical protein